MTRKCYITDKIKSQKETKTMENNKFDKPLYDCLDVTTVQVYPISEGCGLRVKAMASIVLNDQFLVRGLRIMDGANGFYVGYPNDPFFKDEDFRTIYNPITRQLRERIENKVLEKYLEQIAK